MFFVLGIILLAAPFAAMGFYDNKKKGFLDILLFLLASQTLIALASQALRVFYYPVIFIATILADIGFLGFMFFKKKGLFSFSGFITDWVLLFVIMVSAATLWQVHYNYTGMLSSVNDINPQYHQVKNFKYVYPYFSDEWYAVSLSGGAIKNHSLPTVNVLSGNFFLNFELFFHSFVAEIMLLLGWDVLTKYVVLALAINVLLVVLAYFFLRLSKVGPMPSGIASLFMLYISCGSNLPGLWHMIPLTLGIIFFLLRLCFIEAGNFKGSIIASIFSFLYYPPLFILLFPGFLALLYKRVADKKKFWKIFSYCLLGAFFAIPLALIAVMVSPLAGIVSKILSRIFFITFAAPNVYQFYFYYVIPVPAIILFFFGLRKLYKANFPLLVEMIIGFALWIAYHFSLNRFFIEYERDVVVMSILVCIVSGFGIDAIIKRHKFFRYAQVAALLAFIAMIPFYTSGASWDRILLMSKYKEAGFPRSPANSYLAQDDLEIFKGIEGKRFLSVPWKGTTIGVATGNFPIVTKAGTISMGNLLLPDIFMASGCEIKTKIAKENKLDYVYMKDFGCPGFKKASRQSSEGFYLHEIQ